MYVMAAVMIGVFIFSLYYLGCLERRLCRINRYLEMRNRRERLRATQMRASGQFQDCKSDTGYRTFHTWRGGEAA